MCMCVHVIMFHHGLDKITVPSHVPKHKGMLECLEMLLKIELNNGASAIMQLCFGFSNNF